MLLFYQISAWVFLIHMFLYAGFYCSNRPKWASALKHLYNTLIHIYDNIQCGNIYSFNYFSVYMYNSVPFIYYLT